MKRRLPKIRVLGACALLAALGACQDKEITAVTPETAPQLEVASVQGSSGTVSFETGMGTGQCLDVRKASTKPGTPLQTWQCHDGSNQQFTLRSNGEIRAGDMCVDADGGKGENGNAIIIWSCHGGKNQQWSLTGAGEIRGINGKCIDVYGGRREDGTSIILWTCHGGKNQKWKQHSTKASDDPPPAPKPDKDGDDPELPRAYVNTRYVEPTGRTIRVSPGDDLQDVLDAARPGDEIVLQAGATYTGNFFLPSKSGSGWIVIRSSGSLPSEGTRVTPANRSSLARLVSPSAAPVLDAKDGAHHWRIVGVEITYERHVRSANAPVVFDDDTHHLILDRSYVHGHSDLELRRCLILNSASSAVIDSYLSECHSRSTDNQAIVIWDSNGPFKIVNNYLEGAGENLMIGGATPSGRTMPADIEIRRNHFFKPLAWRDRWLVKNLIEIKFGKRVLIEGNVFENNWKDGQDGMALNFKEDSSCGWCSTEHITFRNNIVEGVDGGMKISRIKRVLVENNLFTRIGERYNGRMFVLLGDLENLTLEHNTGFAPSHIIVAAESPSQKGFRFRNNLMSRGKYGIFGSGEGEGTSALEAYMPKYVFDRNVLIDADADRYPRNNFFPDDRYKVGFVDAGSGNYRLRSSSPFANKGSDGQDPGADFDALEKATRGVVR